MADEPEHDAMKTPDPSAACCAHSRVLRSTVPAGAGAVRDEWRCGDCGSAFVPKVLADASRELGPQTVRALVAAIIQCGVEAAIPGPPPVVSDQYAQERADALLARLAETEEKK